MFKIYYYFKSINFTYCRMMKINNKMNNKFELKKIVNLTYFNIDGL